MARGRYKKRILKLFIEPVAMLAVPLHSRSATRSASLWTAPITTSPAVTPGAASMVGVMANDLIRDVVAADHHRV